jgi:hypothetical protein
VVVVVVVGGTVVAVVSVVDAAGSSVEVFFDAFVLALGLLDDDDANVLDQKVRNIRFATFMGGGLSTLFPRLLLRKTCCNVVGMRDEKPLGKADDASEVELVLLLLLPLVEFSDGNETLGG